ncbi:hypothetical protein MBAV_004588, partial [Candidatus Magnetobacterium bavaricum]
NTGTASYSNGTSVTLTATLLEAVHVQPVLVVTLTLSVPPEDGKPLLAGVMV